MNPLVFHEEFFDPGSVRWYRRLFDERNAGKNRALSDVEFLNERGFVIEHDGLMVPTRAAVLVFGRARHVRRILPRPVVDCQFIDFTADSWSTDRRRNDRAKAMTPEQRSEIVRQAAKARCEGLKERRLSWSVGSGRTLGGEQRTTLVRHRQPAGLSWPIDELLPFEKLALVVELTFAQIYSEASLRVSKNLVETTRSVNGYQI